LTGEPGGYAWAGKNGVGEKKIVDFGILESSKIFVVAPFCHPKRMDLG
jgi:hypothetical protein